MPRAAASTLWRRHYTLLLLHVLNGKAKTNLWKEPRVQKLRFLQMSVAFWVLVAGSMHAVWVCEDALWNVLVFRGVADDRGSAADVHICTTREVELVVDLGVRLLVPRKLLVLWLEQRGGDRVRVPGENILRCILPVGVALGGRAGLRVPQRKPGVVGPPLLVGPKGWPDARRVGCADGLVSKRTRSAVEIRHIRAVPQTQRGVWRETNWGHSPVLEPAIESLPSVTHYA